MPTGNSGFIFNVNVQCKHAFPKSNVEGNFINCMFGKYFDTLAIREDIVGHRDIYYAKKITFSNVWRLEFL